MIALLRKCIVAHLLAILLFEAAFARGPYLGPPSRDIADCRFASVGADARFIVAGVMEGDTLSNLQFGDRDSVSTIVRVEVEAGTGPLTLFLHSESPVIWDFQGAVERVKNAIIVTRNNTRQVASRGLPEEAVRFPDLAGCPPVAQPPWLNRNNVELYFGRSAHSTAFEGKPKTLMLPAGEFVPVEKWPPRDAKGTERELLMYHPGGFRLLDVKSVVSSLPVITPETYPAEAGLLQLEAIGAIRPAQRAEIDSFFEGLGRRFPSKRSEIERDRFSVDYVITQEIVLPPGMFGAHLKSFLVLAGVPEPRGNVGHGCLILMDGYRSKDDANCRGVPK